VGAVLVDRLDRASREGEGDRFLKLGDVDALLLQVRILARLAGRVKLRCAGPVGVTASNA
jgi:hypothetical protein